MRDTTNFMIYEQPLNEQVRLCLRLEYLFNQANFYLNKDSVWDNHQLLKIILETLQTIERPDLKNKFYQALNQYVYNLSQLENLDGVDKQKLNHTIKKIDFLIDALHSSSKKIGQELRENEFLNTIQQRLYTPAGTCGFSLPAYQLWLQQEPTSRQRQLIKWFNHLELLQEIVFIILKLIRESSSFKTIAARGGFYQVNLDPGTPYQIIRIQLPENKNIFPEISVGRYRLAIHFFNLDIDGHPAQTPEDLTFDMACCKI